MNFPSIEIQGSVISNDLLGRIRSEQALFQQGKDFKPSYTNSALKDEISYVWQEVRGQWTIYKSKLARLKEGETGTTETRNFWILPLLTNLGYNLNFDRKAEEINGKSFPIGYRDVNRDAFPVLVTGYYESLDKRPDNKLLRVSPHALMQEYLNSCEHLYGIVTNGKLIRLLRDATRITRLSFLEFNLEKILEEDLYADFVILYRLLHASRMPAKKEIASESIIEKYHQEGLEAGSTIRSKLGDAVKSSVLNLAKGFLNHPENHELRTVYHEGNLDTEEFYKLQLRIIYRFLFLFVIEERNLVYSENTSPETKRLANIYYNHYSLMRLRKTAHRIIRPEAERHYDLWKGVLSTFSLFEETQIGEKLGIMSLKGDLFGHDALKTRFFDLHNAYLDNKILLSVIKSLGYFENENKVLIAVNYGGLDVEEFGSVYEGLLELKININKVEGSEKYSCSFDSSTERSKSGSHYTPEELVQPLIKHSLDYLIEDKLKEKDPEAALLSLKVADVACGSGHILLSAARRISHELACLYETRENQSREKVEQPSPTYIRKAMKDVVRNCIYGVDKNPLAIELCKIALWLEAYNPGEPLNFLDHHIKCGDAIVGLAHKEELENGIANEAFKSLPDDEKDIAKTFRDKNIKERKLHEAKTMQFKAEFEKTTGSSVQEAMAEYKTFRTLPETTPDEIDKKAKAYQKFLQGKGYSFLKAMADTQIAQFFIPKTTANKDVLITDAEFRQILGGWQGWQDRKISHASVIALENRFFHWFLEFPEVFQNGGFDCVLGNPPYLGGNRIANRLGWLIAEFIKFYYQIDGNTDFVVYFLNRAFLNLRQDGNSGFITSQSIKEGTARLDGLAKFISWGGAINYAKTNVKWPGAAKTVVDLVSIEKNNTNKPRVLNEGKVKYINSYLSTEDVIGEPFKLNCRNNVSFVGVALHGNGFIISEAEAKELISLNSKNIEVVKPYLIGDDFNDSPKCQNSRWVIDFSKYELENAKQFVQPFNIVKQFVFPERINNNRTIRKEKWWWFGERSIGLFKMAKESSRFLITAKTSKHLNFSFISGDSMILDQSITALEIDNFDGYAIVQSTIHIEWSRKHSSNQGGTPRYNPSTSIQIFPFPNTLSSLTIIGSNYYTFREKLKELLKLGLTKTYNAFHAKEVQLGIKASDLKNLDKKAIEKNYGKEVWNLWNHLQKTEGTCSIEEAINGIVKLRELHVEMDNSVLEAYGWTDVALRHDFYEVDYLPENDRVRFTIHPDARKEILKRLLELNHQQYEEEINQGLHKEKDVIKFYEQKGVEVPAGTVFSDKKVKPYKTPKTKKNKLNEPENGYGDLFGGKGV